MSHIDRFRRICVLVFLTVLPRLTGQSVEINAVVGFNGIVKLGTWNPVITEIENTGPSGEFVVSVEVQRGTSYRTNRTLRFEERFSLSGGDKKRFDFAIPVESSGLPVIVRVYRGNDLLIEQKYPVLGNVTRVPLVVALSRTAAFDFLVPEMMVTYPHPELLPARWDSYASADIVVFHNADLNRLNDGQIEAIAQWIDAGGTGVLVGGAHLPRLPANLSRLADLRVAGIRRVSGEAPGFLSQPLDRTFTGDVPVSNIVAVSGKPGDDSLVYRIPRGKGVLIVTAFDIDSVPFGTFDERRAAWASLTVPLSLLELTTQSGRVFENPVASLALTTADTGIPDRVIYLVAATLYVLMVFLLMSFIRKAPRSPLRWSISITALSVAAVVMHVIFNMMIFRPAYLTSTVSVAEYYRDAAYARVTTDFTAVSTSRGDQPFRVDESEVLILPRTRNSLVTARHEGRTFFTSTHGLPWTHDAFRIETMVPFDLDTDLARNDEFISAKLENRSDEIILGGVFIYRGIIHSAGPFAPGDTVEMSFRTTTAPVAANLTSATSETSLDGIAEYPLRRALLVQILADERWRGMLENDAVMFVGWISKPLVTVTPVNDFQHETKVQAIIVVLEPRDTDTEDTDV